MQTGPAPKIPLKISKFSEISRLGDRLKLNSIVVERAYSLAEEVVQKSLVKNRSRLSIACACVYIACRMENVPRTFKETCAESKNSKREIGRVFKLLLPALQANVGKDSTEKFVSRFCSSLMVSAGFESMAVRIAEGAVDLDILPGRSPVTVISAAIYMAGKITNDKRTYKEISEVTKASAPSIKLAYDRMKQWTNALIIPESSPCNNLLL